MAIVMVDGSSMVFPGVGEKVTVTVVMSRGVE